MRKIRGNDWESIVAIVNLILAIAMLSLLKRTGEDAYGVAAAWCAGTSVLMFTLILRRLIR